MTMYRPDDAELDGCDLDFTENPTPDEDVDGVVMFADVEGDDELIEQRRVDLVELSEAMRDA